MNQASVTTLLIVVMFFPVTPSQFKKKKNPVSLKNILDETKNYDLLNLDPCVRFFLFHVTKREVRIKHFCCMPEEDSCLQEKHLGI